MIMATAMIIIMAALTETLTRSLRSHPLPSREMGMCRVCRAPSPCGRGSG